MAYNSGEKYNSGRGFNGKERNNNRNGNRYQSGASQDKKYNSPSREIRPEPVPEEYVDCAEDVMREMVRNITTSKIRNLYSLVMDIYHTENLRHETELLPSSVTGIRMARVRFLYEAGRDRDVKSFVERAKLLEYLKGIGNNRTDLIRFVNYMEALVAYHRYFGGREK